MLQPEVTSRTCWANWGIWQPWKQGRDDTRAVSCSSAPQRSRCSNSTSHFTYFYIFIHSCMFKWSLDPLKSHGGILRFCSPCSAQIRADTHIEHIHVYKSFLFSCKVVAFVGWWLHVKEQLNMEILIYEIWNSHWRSVTALSITNTRVRGLIYVTLYVKICLQMLLVPQSDSHSFLRSCMPVLSYCAFFNTCIYI